ncbi:XPG/RAD2 endonuclease [Penicillium capsulatum]|nr:XPG/RAD2 endonuclease [Penicillium capsulatum]
MGVTGLWTVVQPCARPIKLETLNKKRLAVDASIWIYQFLKAVRDKEGNALRNSHVVGFFRRICKLLYFGIRPVFVFDGGAPVLKRQTIAARKKRREGRREDAVQTAGKLLAVQMQRKAEEEAENRRRAKKRQEEEEEAITETPVYADETFMDEQERQRTRKFKKKDAYHLPNMDVSLEEMGAPNDPRIMSQEELEQYARQFHQGQDINLYDFSKIDFDSPFFLSLPASDRYNILNAARLRSRLRMGYSKEQLDTMFQDRMAFSKFQIERVKERNDLTQRLMNINGMNGEEAFHNSGQRIAGERGKEYVLVKDRQHEGGWVLGVVGNKDEGQENKPIDVDRYGMAEALSGTDDASEDDEFEDVPIEGLNRLPKLPMLQKGVFDQALHQHVDGDSDMQRALEESRRDWENENLRQPHTEEADDSLFVQDHGDAFPRPQNQDLEQIFDDGEEDELHQAIALSLQPDETRDEDVPEIPINRPSDDDEMDFAAAVAQTRVTKKPPTQHAFSGPLPFESINLSQPTKKAEEPTEAPADAGGFVKDPSKAPKKSEPLPPWFVGERSNKEFIIDPVSDESEKKHDEREPDHLFLSNRRSPGIISLDDDMPDTKEVIDLEADEERKEKNEVNTPIKVTPTPNEIELHPALPETRDPGHSDFRVLGEPTKLDTPVDEPRPAKAQEEPPQKESTPEADDEEVFEDVLPPPSAPVPEVTVGTDRPLEPHAEPLIPETMVEDDGEFSDPEDEELLRQLAAEGEEHVRFAKTLNSAAPSQDAFDYEQELKQLRAQQQKDRRDADEVTQIMINECQQLLRLFGLPYVTAPMEAEAQCAELVTLGLVDGIVTDDSDTFLFGGTRVYKNMFNQSKFVECYLTSDFEKEYSLYRQKLISFAHLLGSDYTEGIPGIGPVTALEIVTEFSSLEEFRDWWTQVQMGINNPDDTHLAFRKKFRKKASKIFLPPSFPDSRVETAYLEPEVDSDPSPFQWGVPDLNGLRHFLMTTIGWSQERTDEILVPVIRDMNRREQEGTQSNITQFIQGPQGAGAFAPRARAGGASRMEKAFSRLRQEAQTDQGSRLSPEDGAEDVTAAAPSSGKRGTRPGTTGASKKRKTRTASEAS